MTRVAVRTASAPVPAATEDSVTTSAGTTEPFPTRSPAPAEAPAPAETQARPAAAGGRTWAARYGLAVAAVAVATALTWVIWVWIKPQVSPLFFLALLVVAWYGGLGPALLSTALSAFVSIYAFSDPVYSVRVDPEDFLRVGAFVIVSVAVSALADGRRRADAALRQAQAGLEQRVAERTGELARVNTALQHEVREKQAAQNQLMEHQSRLQDLAAEVVLAEQRERRRIAERLHDDLAQLLALSQIRIGGLRALDDPARRLEEYDAIEDLVEEALTRTRSITCELSPPVLYELGLDAAIQWLVEQFRGQVRGTITLQCSGEFKGLSEEARITVFQISRELLANVAKHARARKVGVLLARDEGGVSILVEDDGVGFDPAEVAGRATSTSFGLFSIRERLKRHDGTLTITTEPGAGTRVAARLPIATAASEES